MRDGLDRRDFIKAAGAAGAAAMFGQPVLADSEGVSADVIDEQFDFEGGIQDALVVFDRNESVDRLGELDLADGFYQYRVLPIGFTRLRPGQIGTVAEWDEVRRVKRAEELDLYNTDASRKAMNVAKVHAHQNSAIQGYAGDGLDVVVIDTGVDASHPGIDGRVEANFRYVDEPLGDRDAIRWQDVSPGDSDAVGHGTHCAGIIAGDGGGAVSGDYHGMAPKAKVTAYSTTQSVYLPYVVDAWDHMLHRAETVDGFDPKVVSNSYGVARGAPYNPNDPVSVATWEAFSRGILPVFAQGNDGSALGTSSRFAKAPHVLGVAAGTTEKDVIGFSSRGRAYDPEKAEQTPTKYIGSRDYHDRSALISNLQRFKAIQSENSQLTVSDGTFSGTFGAGINTSPGVSAIDEETGVQTRTIETYPNADLVNLSLSLQPEGQWVRLQVYEEEITSGNKVASMREEPFKQHDSLTFDVEGGKDYVLRLEPELSSGGEFTIDYEVVDKLTIENGTYQDVALSDFRPLTLFRPGIVTHGVSVMSAEDPHDALAPLGPLYGGSGTEPFYHRMSGTSMACPAAAGIALLVYDAYRQAHEGAHGTAEDPHPLDVIRILEHTARDTKEHYTPANAGAGFIDAKAAVDLAAKLARTGTRASPSGLDVLVDSDVPTPVRLTAAGSRSDDGSVFTGGQTDQVTVTLESFGVTNAELSSTDTVRVKDVVPAGWTVLWDVGAANKRHSENVNDDSKPTIVDLGTVKKEEVADAAAKRTYFVEAPSGLQQSGGYTFGGAKAVPGNLSVTLDDDSGVTFTGTDTNYVVGPAQPDL